MTLKYIWFLSFFFFVVHYNKHSKLGLDKTESLTDVTSACSAAYNQWHYWGLSLKKKKQNEKQNKKVVSKSVLVKPKQCDLELFNLFVQNIFSVVSKHN